MCESIFWKEKNCEKITFPERHFLEENVSFQRSFSFSYEKPSCKIVETTVIASWRQISRFSKSYWYIQWICFLLKENSIQKSWSWLLNCSRKMRQFWICFLFDKRMIMLRSFIQEALLISNKSCDTHMTTWSKFTLSWFCGIVFGHYCSLWVSFLKMIVSKSKFLEVIC